MLHILFFIFHLVVLLTHISRVERKPILTCIVGSHERVRTFEFSSGADGRVTLAPYGICAYIVQRTQPTTPRFSAIPLEQRNSMVSWIDQLLPLDLTQDRIKSNNLRHYASVMQNAAL